MAADSRRHDCLSLPGCLRWALQHSPALIGCCCRSIRSLLSLRRRRCSPFRRSATLLEAAAQYPSAVRYSSGGGLRYSDRPSQDAHLSQSHRLMAGAAGRPVFGLREAARAALATDLLLLALAIPARRGLAELRGRGNALWLTVEAAPICSARGRLALAAGTSRRVPELSTMWRSASRGNWAQAPDWSRLSYWAMGQARVIAKPKVDRQAQCYSCCWPFRWARRGEQAIAIAAGALGAVLPGRRFGRCDGRALRSRRHVGSRSRPSVTCQFT